MPLTLQATPETEPVDAAGRWPQSVAEFEDLVETVQDELVHFAFCRLRSLEDAEDTVQDVLVRAYLKREKRRGVTGVRPYLFRMVANTVAERTREIGIRMALGAQRRDAMTLILRQALALTVIGTALGLVCTFYATRLLRDMLFGVSLRDPLTFAAVIALMLAVALVASYVPARRATKVDPMVALRYE
jgi:hypothetical protein